MCLGMQAVGCASSQLDATQDCSSCSWVQRGFCSASVQVGWEDSSKTLCDLQRPSQHGGTQGMSLPTTTKKSCAVPGIQETGAVHEEAHADIHLFWDIQSNQSVLFVMFQV